MSPICWLFPGTSLKIPYPTKRVAPCNKPKLSVQPGNGSYAAVPIIEGLKITIGT